ncbi:lysozyme [Brenneria uluponensis]|uniref:lysozyme n=1 Tax=Brenneria uluponensis TaxID=3057057 RepID=UPI0028ED9ECB|nr:lysozyme [Brenneria ulupoensis]
MKISIPDRLRNRLLAAVVSGCIAISSVFVGYFEGKSNSAYRDLGGVWTVCYGHTSGVKPSEIKTDAECDALLQQDLQPALSTVDRLVTVPLNEIQRAALVSFVFNVGSGNFQRSTLLKKLNQGDITGACDELRRWNNVHGVPSKGLSHRRETERALCLGKL